MALGAAPAGRRHGTEGGGLMIALLATMRGRVSAMNRYGYPLAALVRREIARRYAATTLGMGWAVLQPLALMAIYVVVFTFVLDVRAAPGSGPIDFALYLLCGLLPHLAISDALLRSCGSLRENKSLLERVSFPAEVVPAIGVVTSALPEVIGLGLLVGAAAVVQGGLSPWVLLLPVLVLLRIAMTVGVAWTISVLTVFVGDLAEGLSLVLTVLLFLTPVFYPVEAMPAALAWTLWVNPLYAAVSAYRAVILDGVMPLPAAPLLVIWAAVFVASGLWFFRKAIDRAKDFL